MTAWLDWLANAPDGLLVFTSLMTLVAVYFGFSGMRRCRLIEDVPTARVRSAPQGYVELIGTAHAMDGEPIMAPLSHTACCWYKFKVEKRSGKDWRVVQSGSSDGIFLLRDATGDCVIDPEGAEVTSRHKRSWSGNGSSSDGHAIHARLPSLGSTADTVVDIGGSILETLGAGVGTYRYTESVILGGDPMYAIGWFRTLGAAEQGSTLRELTGAILREWKQRPDTLRERFDSNRDGQIDMQEWEHARSVAEKEAAREHAENLKRDQLHTLIKPGDGRFFLLSNLEEFDLLRRYRWQKRIGFGFFALLGVASLLMISTRF